MSIHPEIEAVLAGDSEGCIVTGDCLEIMADMPDGCVDAVVTDPPYGITWKATKLFGKACPQTQHLDDLRRWDKRPSPKHFREMRRVSQEQVIWGGNYFAEDLGDCPGPLVWDKKTGANAYADGELAWTSCVSTMRILTHQWCGVFKDSERGDINLHPTQKPVAVMIWAIENVRPQPSAILDPFCGSGTTCVAAKKLGRRWIGIEIDGNYAEIARRRVASTPRPLFTEPTENEPDAKLF